MKTTGTSCQLDVKPFRSNCFVRFTKSRKGQRSHGPVRTRLPVTRRTMNELRLPIIDRETTKMSIHLWNVGVKERESLNPRVRKEAWRKLKNAAKRFGIEMTIEK